MMLQVILGTASNAELELHPDFSLSREMTTLFRAFQLFLKLIEAQTAELWRWPRRASTAERRALLL
jgi:hypothetical protein